MYHRFHIDEALASVSEITPELEMSLEQSGETLPDFIRRQLYTEESPDVIVSRKGKSQRRGWKQGHHLDPALGKRIAEAQVMVLPYAPLEADFFCMPQTEIWQEQQAAYSLWDRLTPLFEQEGFENWESWFMTFLVKYTEFEGVDRMTAKDERACRFILEQELKRVRPEYILALGTRSLLYFLGKTSAKAESVVANQYRVQYECADGTQLSFTIICAPSPKQILDPRDGRLYGLLLQRQLKVLHACLDPSAAGEVRKTDYHFVRTAEELRPLVKAIKDAAKKDPKRRVIAVDLEWEGEYPEEDGAYLLTVQFSSRPGEAVVAVFNEGPPLGTSEDDKRKTALKGELKKLLLPSKSWRPRVGGHFLRADMPWLLHLGLVERDSATKKIKRSILDSYAAPDEELTPDGEPLCKYEGGWDTSLMYHAFDEKDSYGLKYLVGKELGFPQWDIPLTDYIAELKARDRSFKLKGYGCIPPEILHPYAAQDADYTRTLAELCMFGLDGRPALLDEDAFGKPSWRPYWLAHRASLGFFEIEYYGLLLDRGRYRQLSEDFRYVADILLEELRRRINWPEFNPASTLHRQAILFSAQDVPALAGVLPEGAVCQNLAPVYDSKYKQLWEQLEDLGEANPSTDKNVLDMLARINPVAQLLKDICKLTHTLGSVLSEFKLEEDLIGDHTLYKKGHFQFLRTDGRIHSHMRQLLATGRSASSRPNLQNLGKSAEVEYARILGTQEKDGTLSGAYLDVLGEACYRYPVRTIYKAAEDYILMEADLTGAELATMAWISQDPNMMEHVRRNILPESDPDFYDIHSHIAVQAFRLDCEPTKKGLAAVGKKHLRIAAKAVAFGIPYGRGAKAIAFQCRTQGIDLSKSEAEGIIQTYFDMYPRTRTFLDTCKASVRKPGYVETLYGRKRRFHYTSVTDDETEHKMGREFCNAPIQGTVADSINVAIFNLLKARREDPALDFRIVMQIHDALLLEVHKDSVLKVYREVFPNAMVRDNPVLVDGTEYRFGIEQDLYKHWGVALSEEEANALGFSLEDL